MARRTCWSPAPCLTSTTYLTWETSSVACWALTSSPGKMRLLVYVIEESSLFDLSSYAFYHHRAVLGTFQPYVLWKQTGLVLNDKIRIKLPEYRRRIWRFRNRRSPNRFGLLWNSKCHRALPTIQWRCVPLLPETTWRLSLLSGTADWGNGTLCTFAARMSTARPLRPKPHRRASLPRRWGDVWILKLILLLCGCVKAAVNFNFFLNPFDTHTFDHTYREPSWGVDL